MITKKFKSLCKIFMTRGLLVLLKSTKNYLLLILFRNIFNKERIVCKVNDYKMILLTRDKGISRSLILFGTRENDKQFILDRILTKEMNIFDVGSNIGFYSIFLKKKSRGKLLAIEPSIENLNLCKENLKLNEIGLSKISFLNAAASNNNSKKTFYISSQSNLHTLNPEGSARRYLIGETRNIRSYSIYYLSKKYFKPDLLRMDVEGHECEIISGMLRFIKTRFFRPHICFEPHITSYSKKNNFSLTLKKLFSLGYYTNLLSSNAKSGTIKISNITHKKCIKIIKSDGEQRGIFENLRNEDTVNILTKTGGARTVLLSPRN